MGCASEFSSLQLMSMFHGSSFYWTVNRGLMADLQGPSGAGFDGYFAGAARPASPAPGFDPVAVPPPAAAGYAPPNQYPPPPVNQFGTPVASYPPPPGAPAAGWPAYPPTPPAGSAKRKWLIAGGAATVALVLVAAAVGVYVSHNHPLSLPGTLNGQPMMNDTGTDIVRRGLADELKSVGARDAVVGIYGVPGDPYAMVLAARTPTHSGDAGDELSGLEAGMSQNAALTGMTDVATGKFSGRMQCGEVAIRATNVPVCAWGDDTVGVEVLYRTPLSDAPATALSIREAIEH